jgi:hypothetical protein
MRCFHLYRSAVLLLIALLASVSAFAQSEEVDVRQITFRAGGGFQTIPSFTMLVRKANGDHVVYQGFGDAMVNQITSCESCQIPNTFSSNVYQDVQFPDGSSGMAYQWESFQSGKYVRIHVDQVTSPPFVIDPRQTWKPHRIIRRVPATLSGRVEIFDENGDLVAYDNSVELNGRTEFYFSLLNNNGSRALDFASIISILNAPL